jgi:hypothetical protein
MKNETKIICDSAPMVLFTLMDCTTYGELVKYFAKKNIKWELHKQSNTVNTIKFKYLSQTMFHDFEIAG